MTNEPDCKDCINGFQSLICVKKGQRTLAIRRGTLAAKWDKRGTTYTRAQYYFDSTPCHCAQGALINSALHEPYTDDLRLALAELAFRTQDAAEQFLDKRLKEKAG